MSETQTRDEGRLQNSYNCNRLGLPLKNEKKKERKNSQSYLLEKTIFRSSAKIDYQSLSFGISCINVRRDIDIDVTLGFEFENPQASQYSVRVSYK